ncbi:MAG: TRAP transporter large permease subunit, partial [Parvibaculales bacterium]
MSIYIPILLFFLLLGLNVPIAFAISFTTLITMLFTIDMGPALTTMAQRMATGIDSFALLAIPFFILSGYIMGQGGMAKRLIDATKALIGMIPGGLAFTNIVSCMLFGSISGSAVAASSAIGSFMIPEMKKAGYSRAFSSAVTVAGSTTGLLIPPSNVLIVYAVASGGASIAALFAAGYVPGILLGLALMVVCGVYAKAKNFPVEKPLPFMDILQKLASALPAILL